MPRGSESHALLVTGHAIAPPTGGRGETAEHDRLARVLQADPGAGWRVTRLGPQRVAEQRPSRVALKRSIADLTGQAGPMRLLALHVDLVAGPRGAALVAGRDWQRFPEDATLELAWVAEALSATPAVATLVVVAIGDADERVSIEDVARTLDAGSEDRLVAVGRGREVLQRLGRTLGGAAAAGPVTLGVVADALRPVATVRVAGDQRRELVRPASHVVLARQPASALATAAPVAANEAPDDAAADEDLTGATLPGRFKLVRQLARGAHGVVYLARQLSVDRAVAVKVLDLPDQSRHYGVKHFVQEIQTIGRLDHPNLIRIHQADVAPSGHLFYAMELVRGPTLAQHLERHGTLVPARAVSLISQVLRGLQAAHDAGVVHSDVKPANIALQPPAEGTDARERVIVLDFGVARLRQSDEAQEALGASLGYMAPEQATDGRVDARSDLFSAALIFYQMLTGWRRQGLDRLVPPLTPTEVPDPHLLGVLQRALALEPARRFATAQEFLTALGASSEAAPAEGEAGPALGPRWLRAYVEDDRYRFHGRVLATSQLTDLVLFNRVVILTSRRGEGKTSLLRAGLVPRLAGLHVRAVYVSCRVDPIAATIAALEPGAASLEEAVQACLERLHQRTVICFDHVESLVFRGSERGRGHARLFEAIGRTLDAAGDDVGVVLAVRSDQLGRLVELRDMLAAAPPVMRLGPLTVRGAREAVARCLEEAGAELPGSRLDALMEAVAAAGHEHYDGAADACYPPHVQALASRLTELGLQGDGSVQAVGSIADLIGAYVRRSLGEALREVPRTDARSLLEALVGDGAAPVVMPETELRRAAPGLGRRTLRALRDAGLLVPWRVPGHPLGWSLVHEIAIPPLLDWILGPVVDVER